MKNKYLSVLLVSCVLLFSGCVSQGPSQAAKDETADPKGTLAQDSKPTTEFISPTTTHEYDPNKCSYPQDAFSACAGKAEKEYCEYVVNGKNIEGECKTEPCGKVVCKSEE